MTSDHTSNSKVEMSQDALPSSPDSTLDKNKKISPLSSKQTEDNANVLQNSFSGIRRLSISDIPTNIPTERHSDYPRDFSSDVPYEPSYKVTEENLVNEISKTNVVSTEVEVYDEKNECNEEINEIKDQDEHRDVSVASIDLEDTNEGDTSQSVDNNKNTSNEMEVEKNPLEMESDTDSDDDLENIKPKTWAGWFILKGAKILDFMDRLGEKVLGGTTYMDNAYEDIKYLEEKEKEFEIEGQIEDQSEVVIDELQVIEEGLVEETKDQSVKLQSTNDESKEVAPQESESDTDSDEEHIKPEYNV